MTRYAGITKHVSPRAAARVHHRRAWIPGHRCGTCRKPRPTSTRGPPCATTGQGPAWTAIRPTSSPPTSPGQRVSPASQALEGSPAAIGQAATIWDSAEVLTGCANSDREPLICAAVRCATDSPEVNAEKMSARVRPPALSLAQPLRSCVTPTITVKRSCRAGSDSSFHLIRDSRAPLQELPASSARRRLRLSWSASHYSTAF